MDYLSDDDLASENSYVAAFSQIPLVTSSLLTSRDDQDEEIFQSVPNDSDSVKYARDTCYRLK